MPPCGCSGSTQQNVRRPGPVRQASPSAVPGGPGEPGFTWDGPQRAAAPAAPAAPAPARAAAKKK